MHKRSIWAWTGLLVALGMTVGGPAHAHPRAGWDGPYSLWLEDEHGGRLRAFEQRGELFVLGRYGTRYAIVLRNNTGRRVEAVVTVDGRDVVSGRIGDFVRGRGYVLGPWASLRIEGFRQSLEAVATFRFSDPADSYSSRLGTPQHVGVIGAAFFPERAARPRPRLAQPEPPRADPSASYDDHAERRLDAPAEAEAKMQAPASESARAGGGASTDAYVPAPQAAAPSVNNLGTEYGESRTSYVEEVRFVRASPDRPAQVAVLRYDDEAGLRARGIEIEPRVSSYREPNPFPHSSRFAPPPP